MNQVIDKDVQERGDPLIQNQLNKIKEMEGFESVG